VAIEHAYAPEPTKATQPPQKRAEEKPAATTAQKSVTPPPAPPTPAPQTRTPPATGQAAAESAAPSDNDWFDLTQPTASPSEPPAASKKHEKEPAAAEQEAESIVLSEEEQLDADLLNLFAEPEVEEPGIEITAAPPAEPTKEDRLEDLLVDMTLAKASPPADEMADLQEMVAADSDELQAVLDFAEEESEETPPPAPPGSYSLPPELEARPLRSTMKNLLYIAGILLLIGGLVVQYAYSHRVAMMEQETLRPWLTRLCDLMQCPLPPQRALDKIELADHLVQSHPRYQHSLLITATLINRADYVQPFPIVEVVMSDLQQKVVARRQFRPEQYLVGDTAEMGFTPNVEVPLMLEVVDPGENAVGFEFNFY